MLESRQVIAAWDQAVERAKAKAPRTWREQKKKQVKIEQAPWVNETVVQTRRNADAARKMQGKLK